MFDLLTRVSWSACGVLTSLAWMAGAALILAEVLGLHARTGESGLLCVAAGAVMCVKRDIRANRDHARNVFEMGRHYESGLKSVR